MLTVMATSTAMLQHPGDLADNCVQMQLLWLSVIS